MEYLEVEHAIRLSVKVVGMSERKKSSSITSLFLLRVSSIFMNPLGTSLKVKQYQGSSVRSARKRMISLRDNA